MEIENIARENLTNYFKKLKIFVNLQPVVQRMNPWGGRVFFHLSTFVIVLNLKRI